MVSADRLTVETRLDSPRRSLRKEVRLRAACSWELRPGPSSIPVTTAPPVTGAMPTSSYRVLPGFLVGKGAAGRHWESEACTLDCES